MKWMWEKANQGCVDEVSEPGLGPLNSESPQYCLMEGELWAHSLLLGLTPVFRGRKGGTQGTMMTPTLSTQCDQY
jgi:hypothetical protein